jgi:hypothetical protein
VNIRIRSLAGSVATLIFGLLLTLSASAQVAISVNGNDIDVSPSPLIQAGRVFVPLRGVFENLGATVVYSNGQINATGNGRDISLQIGSTQAEVDGQPTTIDVAPFIVGASTYVPLRFVSQALGAGVQWDEADRLVEISMSGAPTESLPVPSSDQDGDWVDSPPPAIPYYEPPPAPEQNDIWVPGYWAWGEGGYYWVAGTWTQPPQTDYLWTPGYWAYNNNSAYVWHQGYWGLTVGFYGGINYGAGYYGHGYVGGRWSGNQFHYNTAVTPVNRTVIHNVYVDKTVINNTTVNNHISYNGGPRGVTARPTATELAAARAPHQAMTAPQVQHAQVAGQDRRNLATVNAGKPAVVVAPHPFTSAAKPAGFAPVTTNDRSAGQQLIARPPAAPHAIAPAARPAAVAAPARPAYAAPAARPAVVAPARPAYAAPAARPAVVAPAARPAVVAPAARPAVVAPAARPAYVAPAARPAVVAPAARPAYVAPAARPVTNAPVYVHHAPVIPAVPAAPAAAPARPAFVRPAAVPAPAAARPAAAAPVRPGATRQIPPGEHRAPPDTSGPPR